jgi:methyl-accepting chemotaxis protein
MKEIGMSDIPTQILQDIREEARITNQRLDQQSARLDQQSARLDLLVERVDRIGRRQVEMETRLATEVVAVAGAVHELRDILLADRDLRGTVADHERRIGALEQQGR